MNICICSEKPLRIRPCGVGVSAPRTIGFKSRTSHGSLEHPVVCLLANSGSDDLERNVTSLSMDNHVHGHKSNYNK